MVVKMKEYEVWEEGGLITGNSAPACLLGTLTAGSFQEACDTLLEDDEFYNSMSLSRWGCRLYPSEEQARKNDVIYNRRNK